MEDANRLADEVEALLAIGGFKLKNWTFSEDHNKSIDIRNAVFSRLNRSEVITTAQLHSTKPECRFCTGSNPARGVSEIRDGEISDNGPGWK